MGCRNIEEYGGRGRNIQIANVLPRKDKSEVKEEEKD